MKAAHACHARKAEEPGERDGYRVLAKYPFVAFRAVAFIGECAVVANAEFNTVPARAAHAGANCAFVLFETRHRTVMEILPRANVVVSASDSTSARVRTSARMGDMGA
jgi:hypothetical protein